MAKALLGHVGGSELLLQSEVRRLRARVRDLQAEVDRLRTANAELQAAVSMRDELIHLSVSDAEPALT